MTSFEQSELDHMVNTFMTEYDSKPDHEKVPYISYLIAKAVDQPDAIIGELNGALLRLDAISVFVARITARDKVSIDQAELNRLSSTRTRFTRTRVLVKQQKMQEWLGDEEYTACFDKVAGISAVEELQQFLTRGRDILCARGSRRLIYGWINYAMGLRLGSKRRGIRKNPAVTRGDIRKARGLMDKYLDKVSQLAPPLRIDQERHEFSLIKARYRVFKDTFLQKDLSLNRFGLYSSEKDEGDDVCFSSDEESMDYGEGGPITPPNSEDNNERGFPANEISNNTNYTSQPRPATAARDSEPIQTTADKNSSDQGNSTRTADEMDIESRPGINQANLRPQSHRFTTKEKSNEDDKCTCDKTVVRKELWGYTATLKNPHDVSGGEGLEMDEDKRICLTPECRAAMKAYVETPTADTSQDSTLLVCHSTRRRLMKMVNIANNVSRAEADRRIRSLWESRDDIRAWRALHDDDCWLTQQEKWLDNPGNTRYFRYAAKLLPPVPFDRKLLKQQMFGEDWETVDLEMKGLGNSVYNDGFSWIREDNSNLISLLREEMDVVHYHTYRDSRYGRHYKGWSNSSHFTLGMQAIRQDLALYGQTLATRIDSTPYGYQLTCIPAQAKHVTLEDRPFFRHIDFNPSNLDNEDLVRRDKTGQYRIQVAVSLDDEDKQNCTYVIDGLRNNNFEDLEKLCSVSRISTGKVVSLKPDRVNSTSIQEAIGRTFRPIPVRAGGVRFMDAVTFHGSSGAPTKIRRVLFPWYTRVDPEQLETGEVKSSFETEALQPVEDYILSNMTLKAPPSTGGGQAPLKSRLPFRFNPHSLLLPRSHLAAALAGMTPWDQPMVQADARKFFFNPYVLIKQQRREMVQAILEHMRTFRQAEQDMFGEDSFYKRFPERDGVMQVRGDWIDSLDRAYESHQCVQDFFAGTGPAKECKGAACIIG